MEVCARDSLKVATKEAIRGEKTLKIYILGCFSKAKIGECDKNVLNVVDQFGITIHFQLHFF